MFLLDTNVVSELRKARSANSGVTDWADAVSAELMFMSVISVQELEVGVLRVERRDPPKGRVLRDWLGGRVLPAFSGRILPVDVPVARRAAALHVPNPAPLSDALIGATALVLGMTVVTRNVRAFERFADVAVLNPWT